MNLDALAELLAAPVPPRPAEAVVQTAEIAPRFEDLTQDGRVVIPSLLPGLGRTAWKHLLEQPLARALREEGVIPILTRFVALGGGGPVGVVDPVQAEGAYGLFRADDEAGGVARLVVGMWLTVTGKKASVYGPPPEDVGAAFCAGRIYAEHVLTRPFASERAARRVLALPPEAGVDVAGLPRLTLTTADSVTTRPDREVKWLDDMPETDSLPLTVGLAHTDPNQHTNSMVYVRWFEEAALRRLSRHGLGRPLLARAVHVAFRKPSFAGQQLTITLRTFEQGGHLGAVGTFAHLGEDRPSVKLALLFDGGR